MAALLPAPEPARSVLKIVELVRTPLGPGLTVDERNRVVAIAEGSQAARSGCFAVHDQLASLNGVPLSGDASFEEQLSGIAFGTKMIVEINKPVRPLPRINKAGLTASFLKSAQPGASASKVQAGSSEPVRVLLEGRMSVRISGSPFHVPSVLKLTVASNSAERNEPWTTFSYTSSRMVQLNGKPINEHGSTAQLDRHGTVSVPCRAISAVRVHPGHAHPSFELEYVGPPEAAGQKAGRKKQLGRVITRLRVWATSQEQFEEWRMALAPLPLTDGSPMDRARAWLEHRISELPGSEPFGNGSV